MHNFKNLTARKRPPPAAPTTGLFDDDAAPVYLYDDLKRETLEPEIAALGFTLPEDPNSPEFDDLVTRIRATNKALAVNVQGMRVREVLAGQSQIMDEARRSADRSNRLREFADDYLYVTNAQGNRVLDKRKVLGGLVAAGLATFLLINVTSTPQTATASNDGKGVATRNVDGSTTVTFGDGTSETTQLDGTVVTTRKNGEKTTRTTDGVTTTTYQDGRKLVTQADGTSTETLPDGSTTTRNAKGEVISNSAPVPTLTAPGASGLIPGTGIGAAGSTGTTPSLGEMNAAGTTPTSILGPATGDPTTVAPPDPSLIDPGTTAGTTGTRVDPYASSGMTLPTTTTVQPITPAEPTILPPPVSGSTVATPGLPAPTPTLPAPVGATTVAAAPAQQYGNPLNLEPAPVGRPSTAEVQAPLPVTSAGAGAVTVSAATTPAAPTTMTLPPAVVAQAPTPTTTTTSGPSAANTPGTGGTGTQVIRAAQAQGAAGTSSSVQYQRAQAAPAATIRGQGDAAPTTAAGLTVIYRQKTAPADAATAPTSAATNPTPGTPVTITGSKSVSAAAGTPTTQDVTALYAAAFGQSAPATPATPAGTATVTPAPAGQTVPTRPSPYRLGQQMMATLQTGVRAPQDGSTSLAVYAMTDDRTTWRGWVNVDATKRVNIIFDRAILSTGEEIPVEAAAYNLDGTPGVKAFIHDVAPSLANDLIRSAVSGVHDYAEAKLQATTTSVTGNGTVVVQRQAPSIYESVASSTSKIFALPATQSTFVTVAEIPAYTKLVIIYGPTGSR